MVDVPITSISVSTTSGDIKPSGDAKLLDDTQPISKNAMKRAAKAERFKEVKLARRAKEKQMRKEKKATRAAKRAAGELDDDDDADNRKAKKVRTENPFGGRIIIDLGFDELMSEKERKSLCSQLAYTYSSNRRFGFPFDLVYTSLNGNTMQLLEGMSDAAYTRWANTKWTTDGYELLWETPNLEGCEELPSLEAHSSKFPRESIVYLTADSEVELEELKPNETYIIGGLVDHNRYKNICLNKAKDARIRTARLPIGKYLSLATRKVLTVNQAFDILLHWVDTKDWEKAFHEVIPKRKFQGSETIVQEDTEDNNAAGEPEHTERPEQPEQTSEEQVHEADQ